MRHLETLNVGTAQHGGLVVFEVGVAQRVALDGHLVRVRVRGSGLGVRGSGFGGWDNGLWLGLGIGLRFGLGSGLAL